MDVQCPNYPDIPWDAIVTLLLFLVGAPTLVIQLVSNDVKEVLIRRGDNLWLLLRNFIAAFVGLLIVLGVYWGVSQCVLASYIWNITLGVLFILSAVTAGLIFPVMRKQWVVQNLARVIQRKSEDGRAYSEDDLNDLVLLGRESKAGEEKDWCIQALASLTNSVLRSPHYSGSQLEGVVNSLIKVLLEEPYQGSPENFRSTINILRGIVRTWSQQVNGFAETDLSHAIRALSVLGQRATTFPITGISTVCLNILEEASTPPNPKASQAIREIGTEALLRDQITITMQSLNLLEYMSESVILSTEGIQPLPALNEVVFDFVGLLAYLWGHGESGQEMTLHYLRDLKESPGVELPDLIEKTVYHHRQVSRFSVADKVSQMAEAIEFA